MVGYCAWKSAASSIPDKTLKMHLKSCNVSKDFTKWLKSCFVNVSFLGRSSFKPSLSHLVLELVCFEVFSHPQATLPLQISICCFSRSPKDFVEFITSMISFIILCFVFLHLQSWHDFLIKESLFPCRVEHFRFLLLHSKKCYLNTVHANIHIHAYAVHGRTSSSQNI